MILTARLCCNSSRFTRKTFQNRKKVYTTRRAISGQSGGGVVRWDGGVSERTRYGVWEMDARAGQPIGCAVAILLGRYVRGSYRVLYSRRSGAAALVGTSARVGVRPGGTIRKCHYRVPPTGCLPEPGRQVRETAPSDSRNAPRIFMSGFKAPADRIFFNNFIPYSVASPRRFLVGRLLRFGPRCRRGEGTGWSAAPTLPRLPPWPLMKLFYNTREESVCIDVLILFYFSPHEDGNRVRDRTHDRRYRDTTGLVYSAIVLPPVIFVRLPKIFIL